MKVTLWTVNCGTVIVSCYFFLIASVCTKEFLRLGIDMAVIMLIPAAVILVIFITIIYLIGNWCVWKLKCSPKIERLVLLCPGLLLSLVFVVLSITKIQPEQRFADLISKNPTLKPELIRVAGLTAFLARRWVVVFRANEFDVSQIVLEHNMFKTEHIDYEKSVCGDLFLKRVDWLAKQGRPNRPIAYKWNNPNPNSGAWEYLFYEPETKRAWFYSGFQN